VLGGDLLDHMAVGIYPAAKRLILMPSGSIKPRPSIHSREVPLVAGDHIDARITGRQVRLRVDLGSDSLVTLSDDAWNAILGDRAGARSGSAVRVEGDRLVAERAGGNALAFSCFEADGVVIDHSGALPDHEQGSIGLGILGRMDLIVDFPAGKLILLERPIPAT
jgi:hypothetical protein